VIKTPIEVSEEQIQKLKTLMGVDNNRAVLPVNKRFVLESKQEVRFFRDSIKRRAGANPALLFVSVEVIL